MTVFAAPPCTPVPMQAWRSCVCEQAPTYRWEQGDGLQSLCLWKVCAQSQPHAQGPYRLVVRTSRCGRDNPGSTPGEDICSMLHAQSLFLHGRRAAIYIGVSREKTEVPGNALQAFPAIFFAGQKKHLKRSACFSQRARKKGWRA